jgi:hypothetical protein
MSRWCGNPARYVELGGENGAIVGVVCQAHASERAIPIADSARRAPRATLWRKLRYVN